MASSAVSLTFMIHDFTATGTVVYQESHALTSNAQGLVSCVVGNGVVSEGNFAGISWGGGAKFLHVMMGSTDLGTQQMLSVPYALYANGVGVRASATGDTLTIGTSSVIVPGISAANYPAPVLGCTNAQACNYNAAATQDDGSCMYPNATCDDGNANTMNDVIGGNCICSGVLMVNGCTNAQACNYNPEANVDNGSCLIQGASCNDGNAITTNDVINANCLCAGTSTSGSGTGAQLLPGNATCSTQNISVTGCDGQTSLTYDGRTYDLVEIGGQCWFADNLATDQYRNGDAIPTGLDNNAWSTTTNGAFAIYNNNPANDVTYGKLYNWFTTEDSRGLCPTGWHVPTDCEWMYMEGSLGMSVADQETGMWYRGTLEGGAMKATTNWNSPNTGATNSSGFTALPGSQRSYSNGTFSAMGNFGGWWSSTVHTPLSAWFRSVDYNHSDVFRAGNSKRNGYSVRCVRDSETALILGCTDDAACNFMANANQDDESCLYLNATCDDWDGSTINDVINGNCQCMGILMVNGCVNVQACNYDTSANVDDGSCLIQGASCDDGNANTTNDVINANCQCLGTATGNGVFIPGYGVTDIDGNFYPSVIINGQEWMQKNLTVTKYRNGSPIPTGLSNSSWKNITSGAYSIYNNDLNNNTIYGKLYNWYAVIDPRGLCPLGWHVPTSTEWNLFFGSSLGPSYSAGGKMKSVTGWTSPNTGANNVSGFTGLPGGIRGSLGYFGQIASDGFWWSSSEVAGSNGAWGLKLNYGTSNVPPNDGEGDKYKGKSIRCIKDIGAEGCTDILACNYSSNASLDDGTCLYQNTLCDDGNANTINDVITANCQCGESIIPANLTIGQEYQGGKVAYIFQPGDSGYVVGEIHGLIAAVQDLSGTYQWGCYGTAINGADGIAVGMGSQNTLDMVSAGCGGAASACANLVLNGYSDWFLPSKSELTQLYNNRSAIGNFQNTRYWSSTETGSGAAWILTFWNGSFENYVKTYSYYVRAVRAF